MANNHIKINTIYSTFDGEQNPYGIGHPTIFVRFQGCHLRCYAKTLGVLCDTPEALDLNSDKAEEFTVERLVDYVSDESKKTGIDKVTITGGDPLFRHSKETLNNLFQSLSDAGLNKITVETSGTLDWTPYIHHGHVSFILDWKLESTGINKKLNKLRDENLRRQLRKQDYVKYVVHDDDDYRAMVDSLPLFKDTKATLVAGVYFQGKITTFELFDKLRSDGLLGTIHINLQAHQLEKYMEMQWRNKDLGLDI